MRQLVRVALALMLLTAITPAVSAMASLLEAGRVGARDLTGLLQCRTDTMRALASQHGTADQTLRESVPDDDGLLCLLARDALCASTPTAQACDTTHPTGAYGGYYLARHLMPLVMAMRAELTDTEASHRDPQWLGHALDSVARVLDLLDPGLLGCGTFKGLRTWCTINGDQLTLSTSHRYAVAHLASEIVLLLAECRSLAERCPLADDPAMARRLALWFDLLTWDHVLLEITLIRNSFTQYVQVPAHIADRLLKLEADAATGRGARMPFLFHSEGRALAVAANLLAIDRLLDGDSDPRLIPLRQVEKDHIAEVIERGQRVLAARRSETRVVDFEGETAHGTVYDAAAWDTHPYRRFSAVTSHQRPFTVTIADDGATPALRFAGSSSAVAPDVGLDSGHYRRVVWLHYALENAGRYLERDWSDSAALEGLANQFAYGIYKHGCSETGCKQAEQPRSPPRFANYASGIDGWYRLDPSTPCEPGVPPSGFSLQMMLSENLWWARFNPDVGVIWQRLQQAISDAEMAPPSRGDTAPCGPEAGKRVWHQSYHDIASSDERVDRYYRAAFLAMLRWASFELDSGD